MEIGVKNMIELCIMCEVRAVVGILVIGNSCPKVRAKAEVKIRI